MVILGSSSFSKVPSVALMMPAPMSTASGVVVIMMRVGWILTWLYALKGLSHSRHEVGGDWFFSLTASGLLMDILSALLSATCHTVFKNTSSEPHYLLWLALSVL